MTNDIYRFLWNKVVNFLFSHHPKGYCPECGESFRLDHHARTSGQAEWWHCNECCACVHNLCEESFDPRVAGLVASDPNDSSSDVESI